MVSGKQVLAELVFLLLAAALCLGLLWVPASMLGVHVALTATLVGGGIILAALVLLGISRLSE